MDKQLSKNYNLPNHIAIIPDGNRRWAKERGLFTLEGHRRGFDAANALIKKSREMGIHTLTLWAFSTENWNRSKEEVEYLMNLFESNIETNLNEAKKVGAKIVHLGRKDRIPKSLSEKIINAENQTNKLENHVLNIALDYGGHDEILRAVTTIYKDILEGKINIEDIYNEKGKYKEKYPYYLFKEYLDTKNQPFPYPDLIIRTSGEQRLSGFLSWQCAYSELYFAKVHIPDLTPKKFEIAINDFATRDRRFGGN